MLASVLSTSCGRTGLGTRTDASVKNAPVADGRDAGADGGTSDALTDAAGGMQCTPGLFTLGGLPVPQLPGPPSAVAIADLNGDGNVDLAVTVEDLDTVNVLWGRGDGTFGESKGFATGRRPVPDGRLDVVARHGIDVPRVLLGQSDGTLVASTQLQASSVVQVFTILDVNSDGNADVAYWVSPQLGPRRARQHTRPTASTLVHRGRWVLPAVPGRWRQSR